MTDHNAASGQDSALPAKSTITEIVRDFSVTPRAVRFYEDKGLLSPTREGARRWYFPADRARLALILKCKKLGFTLGEIRQIIEASEGTADAESLGLSLEKCLEQIGLLERQKADIDEALAELRRIYASSSKAAS